MRGLRCPDCGSEKIVLTPEGLLVCSICGRVLGMMLEDKIALRDRKWLTSGPPSKNWKIYTKSPYMITIKTGSKGYRAKSADPIDESVARRLRRNEDLNTRKTATLLALARFTVLTAKKYPMKEALAEASRRYGVSVRLLQALARRYRGLITDLQAWVVEEWRRAYKQTENT